MLKYRLITGFTLTAVMLSVIFLLPAWTHLLLLYLVFLLAQLEFYDMIKFAGHRYEFSMTLLMGGLFLGFCAVESPQFTDCYPAISRLAAYEFSGIVLALTPALLLAAGVFRRRVDKAMEAFALSYAGFWYIAVLLGYIVRIAFEWDVADGTTNYTGRLMLLVFIALVKFSDIGAYTFGRLFGKHKLIPEISPGKTVEGLAGGYVFSVAISLVIFGIVRAANNGLLGEVRYTLPHALVLPLILTTTGVVGDLAESLVKRSVNVKDSGTRFPGMGGILDLLDSLLFSAPFMYLYMVLFMK